MYGRALLWGKHDPSTARALAVRRAEALANAGRASEAADVRLAHAAGAPPAEALALRRGAAIDLLTAGRVDEGTALLREVLPAHGSGYPPTPARALWTLRARVLRLRLRGTAFTPRATPSSGAAQLAVCWPLARVLATIDPIRAGVFAVDALLLALDAGDTTRVACALAFVGCMCAYEGSPASEARSVALLDQAARISWRTDDPYLASLSWGCSGVARMCAGRFREALSRMDESLRLLADLREGVAWERAAYQAVSSRALLGLGALAERARRATSWLATARAEDDRFGEAEATLALALGRIGAGAAADARAEAREAALRVSQEGFYLQHEGALRIEVLSLLHEGRAQAASSAIDTGFRALEASGLGRIQLLRIDALLLRGVIGVAAAAARRAGARGLLRRAEADADLLTHERRPSRARGGGAGARGRGLGARRHGSRRGRPAARRPRLRRGRDGRARGVRASLPRRDRRRRRRPPTGRRCGRDARAAEGSAGSRALGCDDDGDRGVTFRPRTWCSRKGAGTMEQATDVAVVGGGIAGLAAATYLACARGAG